MLSNELIINQKSLQKKEQESLINYLLNETKETQEILQENSITSYLAGGLSVGLQSNYPRVSDDFDLLIYSNEINQFKKCFKKYEMDYFELECPFFSISLPRVYKKKKLKAYIIGCNENLMNMVCPQKINGISAISKDNICAAKTRELVRDSRGREVAKDAFDLVMLQYYNPIHLKDYFKNVNAENDLAKVPSALSLLEHIYFQIKRINESELIAPFPSKQEWEKNSHSIKAKCNISGEESLDSELRILLSLTANSTRKALQKSIKTDEFKISELANKYLKFINEKEKNELKEALINDPEAKYANELIKKKVI